MMNNRCGAHTSRRPHVEVECEYLMNTFVQLMYWNGVLGVHQIKYAIKINLTLSFLLPLVWPLEKSQLNRRLRLWFSWAMVTEALFLLKAGPC